MKDIISDDTTNNSWSYPAKKKTGHSTQPFVDFYQSSTSKADTEHV